MPEESTRNNATFSEAAHLSKRVDCKPIAVVAVVACVARLGANGDSHDVKVSGQDFIEKGARCKRRHKPWRRDRRVD
jgi:hypothetical protein